MPVDITRLLGSEFHAQSSDEAWRAGMTLWLKSFHQVPAASMVDDDQVLARAAEFGRDIRGWRKIRSAALRGWVKCHDGRLYHPVVAEKALEAWAQKLSQRKLSAAGNAKRHDLPFDPQPFDQAIDDALARLINLNPSFKLTRRMPKASRKPPAGTPAGINFSDNEAADGIH